MNCWAGTFIVYTAARLFTGVARESYADHVQTENLLRLEKHSRHDRDCDVVLTFIEQQDPNPYVWWGLELDHDINIKKYVVKLGEGVGREPIRGEEKYLR